MERIEGVKLSDREALDRMRLSRPEIAYLLTAAFSVMIFQGGFVHCDPHPGNLLARPHPSAKQRGTRPRVQLVLLDHGLYRELTSEFRHGYCELWYSLITREHTRGRAAALALGVAPSDYDYLSLLLTFRPASSRTALGSRLGKEERTRLRERLGQLSFADISSFFERMPRDMLFVMRTWAYVRSLNRDLGGTTRSRLALQAEYAARGVSEASRTLQEGWVATLVDELYACFHICRVRLYICLFDAVFRLHAVMRKITPHSTRDLG